MCSKLTQFIKTLFLVVKETVSLVISRQVLSDIASKLTSMNDNVAKQLAHYILKKVSIKSF